MNTLVHDRVAARAYYGWYVVLACAVIACFAWGLGFYGVGMYLTALHVAHGWSTSLISGAITLYYLVGAGLFVVVGHIIDRRGSRGVMAVGALALAGAVAALGFIDKPWQLYASFLLMALGWGSLTVTAISATLAPWFRRRLGLATTLAFTGASAAGFIFTPTLIHLIKQNGFSSATTVCAAALLATVLPLVAFVIKRCPQDLGLLPDGDVAAPAASKSHASARAWTRGEALRTAAFWTLAISFSVALLAQVGFLVHQIPFLTSRIGAEQVALVVAATAIAGPIGRFAAGPLADKINPRLLAIAVFLMQGVALWQITASHSLASLYFWSIVFGLGIGNIITLPSLVVHRDFGAQSFGAVAGAANAITHTALAFGPGFVGILYDAFGSYGYAFAALASLDFAAAAVMFYSCAAPAPAAGSSAAAS
jgi:MFS family permease